MVQTRSNGLAARLPLLHSVDVPGSKTHARPRPTSAEAGRAQDQGAWLTSDGGRDQAGVPPGRETDSPHITTGLTDWGADMAPQHGGPVR